MDFGYVTLEGSRWGGRLLWKEMIRTRANPASAGSHGGKVGFIWEAWATGDGSGRAAPVQLEEEQVEKSVRRPATTRHFRPLCTRAATTMIGQRTTATSDCAAGGDGTADEAGRGRAAAAPDWNSGARLDVIVPSF